MKHPPYHLRTNKAVDRLLLVDVIRALGSGTSYSDFKYYSLAGPFLEDLRVMDHFFPEMELISIESNKQTFMRQKFNQFCSRLDLKNSTLADFLIYHYEATPHDVLWLDYTDLKFQRFSEFQQLLKLVLPESIVRITLRAEPEININSLQERLSDEELEKLRNQLQKSFTDEFYEILPPEIDLDAAFESYTIFANLVQMMIKIAASQALDFPGSDVDFLPVQCTRYNDNTQMVSVTGIVCFRSEIDFVKERLKSINFANFNWDECERIDVPALTVKERLCLEHHLPVENDQDAGEILFNVLGYKIDRSEKQTKLKLSHYADCHRNYPNFVQITI